MTNHFENRRTRKRDLVLGKAVRLSNLDFEVLLGDLQFLLLDVARDLDDFHSILERARDFVQHVGGADEHDVRQIVVEVHVMVVEAVILLRVEHLEKRGRGITAKVHRHLVHFVEHEDRVVRTRLLQALQDLPGERADIGATMTPDLGFVADTAEADPDEIPTGRSGDGFPKRGLSDTGRTHEAQDRPLHAIDQGLDREVLENPLLRLFEPK